ncbi:hypothetical protein PIB30_042116 [Stylosanthes scabra]|uniref:Uncharacterized protein n=1 Tax=Stylosanthes scabra TaxID=79078 RepID=A0ABU6VGM9_9FABA|nr:hypothetical protein [Stylosanthes scabra]
MASTTTAAILFYHYRQLADVATIAPTNMHALLPPQSQRQRQSLALPSSHHLCHDGTTTANIVTTAAPTNTPLLPSSPPFFICSHGTAITAELPERGADGTVACPQRLAKLLKECRQNYHKMIDETPIMRWRRNSHGEIGETAEVETKLHIETGETVKVKNNDAKKMTKKEEKGIARERKKNYVPKRKKLIEFKEDINV